MITRAVWAWVWYTWVALCGVEETRAKIQSGQLYSSLAHVESLFTFDKLVGELILRLPEHLPALTSYLEGYKSVLVDEGMGREVMGNPLHVYTLIKRLVLHWPHINKAIAAYIERGVGPCKDKHPNCIMWALTNECLLNPPYMNLHCPQACHTCVLPEVVSAATEVSASAKSIEMPSVSDLRGAALALSRLQWTYRLPISAIMTGTLAGTLSSVRLSLEDCVVVGNVTRVQKMYSNALIWYRYCLALAQHHHPDTTTTTTSPITTTLITTLINGTIEEHNKNWHPTSVGFFYTKITPVGFGQVPQDDTFYLVCRGVHKQVPESWRLRCEVSDRGSASLRLRPVRMEQVHYNPELYVFYDVVSDTEIEVIKKLSKDELVRSALSAKDVNNVTSTVSEARVSATAWLSNNSHPVLTRLARRIADITGLHVFEGTPEDMAGESLQVLNYGIGGQYTSHLDTLFKQRQEEELSSCYPIVGEGCCVSKFLPGDRLATWMFYLSDVTAGGRTGFPHAGISLPAVRGSAAFWYNLKSNGKVNQMAQHGGCPVLLGQKWVANKWIREHKNFLRRPCVTNE